jgi:glycosyltransferase involved in cell wall biosynthesis
MKLKQSTPIQTSNVRQTTEIATESLTIKNKLSLIYLFIVSLIGFTAPFWHVFHGISQREGVFGYKYMSSFLYALGNPVFMVCIGLLFIYAIRFIDNDSFKKVFRVISFIPLAIGCYYLIAVFIPKSILLDVFGVRDYGNWVYYSIMAIMSLISGYTFKMFQKAIVFTEAILKEHVKKLVHFIISQRKNVLDIEVYEYEMLSVFNEISE